MRTTDLASLVKADARANAGNAKGLFTVISYRLANAATSSGKRWISIPVMIVHRLLTEVLLGVELPATVVAGPGLQVWHGTGLVVHGNTVLGSNVVLRHNTTLGTLRDPDDGLAPVLGDDVSVGTGALVLGPVRVGSGARIGAGSVVTKDVPEGATVVGNPAKVLDVAGGSESDDS